MLLHSHTEFQAHGILPTTPTRAADLLTCDSLNLGVQGADQTCGLGKWGCQANMMLFHEGRPLKDNVSDGVGEK